MARRVDLRRRPKAKASPGRRQSAARVPARRRGVWLGGLIAIAAAAIIGWRVAAPDTESLTTPSAPGFYVMVPHPATAEMRREAAYLARKYNLPQIQEPGASRVEIRRF